MILSMMTRSKWKKSKPWDEDPLAGLFSWCSKAIKINLHQKLLTLFNVVRVARPYTSLSPLIVILIVTWWETIVRSSLNLEIT